MLTPAGRRGADRRDQDLRLLRAHARAGTRRPSASGCTPSRRSAPPTGSARELDFPDRDELLVSSLLHDIGKLVLVQAYPGYPGQIHGDARTPEERLHARAPRARHRPRARRRRDGPPLGPAAAAGGGDRAPPRRRRERRGRPRAPRRHAGPLRAGSGGRARPAAGGRARRSASVPRSCARSCTSFPHAGRRRSATSTRARSRRASSRCSSGSPRARSTSRSRSSWGSRRARCARTCTTSTAKLGAVDRAQAVLIASERGWL